jgi:glycerophosphoryl diester phosphodiesterase
MNRIRAIIIFLLIFHSGCYRVEFYPDDPIDEVVTRVLAHKGGGGSFGEGNSFEACVYGLSLMDGIEVDVQRGEDNQLWLSHSSKLPPCGPFKSSCFASLASSEIIQIDSCLGKETNFATLDTLFAYVAKNYPNKFLSLDVKAWSPCEVNDINITREMNQLAARIIELTQTYGLKHMVMVESETGDFLYYIKTHSDFIETYLTSFSDFELASSKALDAGFSGISYHFKFGETIVKEQIDLIHRKGLKIQLWTIYSAEDLNEAIALGPDFIQTDDL